MNYYNELDKPTAAWLRELIKEGLIPQGEVDERSITDVTPNDVRGFTQCHWFAGIGGWSYALRLAGWPEDRPAWTGSCPCQPFSCAGKGEAQADARHLWPAFFELIRECRPVTVFGEQVADAIGKGWLDGISTDLERADYACWATVLGAHSVAAPHKRRRLYWVANANDARFQIGKKNKQQTDQTSSVISHSNACALAKSESHEHNRSIGDADAGRFCGPANSSGMGNPALRGLGIERDASLSRSCGHADSASGDGGIGNHKGVGSQKHGKCKLGPAFGQPSLDFWSDSTWHLCRDNKLRRIPTQSALFPLADGIPYRVARRRTTRPPLLRGAGNAIVPQVAQIFIEAFLDL